MKLRLLLGLLVIAATACAQQINPVPDYVFANRMSVGRTAVTDTAAYFSIGPRFGATRGFMPPMVVDTASVTGTKRNGLLIFGVQKNKFLYWDSVRVQWSDMAGSSGSYITGTISSNYVTKGSSSTVIKNSLVYDNDTTVAVGTTSPSTKAILELSSTTQGFLLPRMTQTQRTSISSPPVGLLVYQTNGTEGIYLYTNAYGWVAIVTL